jgi:hypothetical protein
MLWKHLLTEPPRASGPQFGAKEMAAIATVWVTSDGADAPIDRAFDQSRGAGGSRWVASLPGNSSSSWRLIPCRLSARPAWKSKNSR